MKLIEIKTILNKLKGIDKSSIPFDFFLLLEQNIFELTKYNSLFENIEKELYLPEYKEFDSKKVNIIKKYSRDEEKVDIPKDKKVYVEKEIKELESEYRVTIKEQDERIVKYENMLSKDVKIDLVYIDINDFPDSLIEKFEILEFMVN